MVEKFRTVEAYKNYFADFLAGLRQPVKDKIYWTIRLIETFPTISEKYLKKLQGTDGLFEIRIEFGGDIFRIFCFFDDGKLIILLNALQKRHRKLRSEKLNVPCG